MLTVYFIINMAAYSNVSPGEQSSSVVNNSPGPDHNMLVLVSW